MLANPAERLGLTSADMPADLVTVMAAAGTILSVTLIEPFGTAGAAMFVLCLGILAAKNTQMGPLAWGDLFPLLVPVYLILSTFWSPAPDATLRASVQCGLGAVAAVLLARTVSARFLLSVLAVSLAVTMPVHVVLDPGGSSMVGVFFSKNQFAGRMALTLFASFYVLARTDLPRSSRLIAFMAWALSCVLLWKANSAGATVATAGGFALMLAAVWSSRVEVRTRAVVLLFGFLTLAFGLALFLVYFDVVFDAILRAFDKDAGLTGRDYLWTRAAQYIAERPYLGTGFSGFWQMGNLEAEGLWRASHVPSGAGFHFHNLYLNILVEQGFVGLALTILYIGVSAIVVLKRAILRPTPEVSFYLAVIGMFLARSFVEVEFPTQFALLTFVLFSAYGFNVERAAAKAGTYAPPRPIRRGRVIANG